MGTCPEQYFGRTKLSPVILQTVPMKNPPSAAAYSSTASALSAESTLSLLADDWLSCFPCVRTVKLRPPLYLRAQRLRARHCRSDWARGSDTACGVPSHLHYCIWWQFMHKFLTPFTKQQYSIQKVYSCWVSEVKNNFGKNLSLLFNGLHFYYNQIKSLLSNKMEKCNITPTIKKWTRTGWDLYAGRQISRQLTKPLSHTQIQYSHLSNSPWNVCALHSPVGMCFYFWYR